MVDRYVVQARIAKIREYVALLRHIRSMTDERRFTGDPLTYGNAERYLQLAIQSVLDISNHVVADLGLGLPADSKELFVLLAKRKIVSTRLAKKLTSMAGFRNLLVHDLIPALAWIRDLRRRPTRPNRRADRSFGPAANHEPT